MLKDGYMTKSDTIYFTDNFHEYQKNGTINFELFCSICREYKGISDKAVLEESLKDLKAPLEKKNQNQQINLKQEEYFNFVNTILKDQAQSKNQNDPEMEKLFRSLAGKDGDYVYKRKLSDIINMFGLPINLNSFFQPVGGQEELNFNEFCCLFRADKADENLRKTFINFIDKSSKEPEEKEDIKAIYKANFPIKYYGE
jgi:hypothetical protein